MFNISALICCSTAGETTPPICHPVNHLIKKILNSPLYIHKGNFFISKLGHYKFKSIIELFNFTVIDNAICFNQLIYNISIIFDLMYFILYFEKYFCYQVILLLFYFVQSYFPSLTGFTFIYLYTVFYSPQMNLIVLSC